jgi:hypothetical protein
MEEQNRRIERMVERGSSGFKRVPVCSNCQSQLTDAEAKGTRCPRCGARWTYNLYEPGGSPAGSSSSRGSGTQFELFKDPETKRTVIGVVTVVVVLAVVVAVAIGVIAVAMAIASASRAGRKYQ